MVVDLEQLIADKVHQRIEEMNGTVEEIVDRTLQAEIDRRVAAILEARANGKPPAGTSVPAQNPEAGTYVPPSKTCVGCGQSKATGEYEKGRNRCRSCRRRQVAESRQRRQQAEADDQERPRTDGQAS